MKKLLAAALCASLTLPSMTALAALQPPAKAPLFTVPATMGGKEFSFSLADTLKQGPVVLYFYPAAFTKGCTIEAHAFAEAVPQYAANGATVVGISNDSIETLNKFSVSECQSKFAVAADVGLKVAKQYDAVLLKMTNYASRTSFVIAPDGQILSEITDMDPMVHVENTLAAVKKWSAEHKNQKN